MKAPSSLSCVRTLDGLGIGHGYSAIDSFDVVYSPDEHVTFAPVPDRELPEQAERVRVWPIRVDPTITYDKKF